MVDEKEKRLSRFKETFDKNMKVIIESGLEFTYNQNPSYTYLMFNNPKCQFVPSTGRWRTGGGKNIKLYSGGPRAFVKWYKKQREKFQNEESRTK